MKKKENNTIEVTSNDFTKQEIDNAVQKKAETTRDYIFKRTYIGMLGHFENGKSYVLTEEQYNKLKEDIKE